VEACRGCKSDSECSNTGPGICLDSGHCVADDEVVYVEFSATGCTGADGFSSKPFCVPSDGVNRLGAKRNVLVLRGPMNGQLTLGTTSVSPVVVGRPNGQGDASIPANAGTAVTVSSDHVVIRDVTVNGGTGVGSKGIVVSGNGTTLLLRNVTVSLGANGLGIEADTGAMLTTDHSVVTGNPKGGIFLNGAGFDLENTKVTSNGPSADLTWGGIRVYNPLATPAKLNLLTVQTNSGAGISCYGMVTGTNVYASGNSPGDIANACGFSSCAAPSGTCGAQF
jgi:hypothetical protein